MHMVEDGSGKKVSFGAACHEYRNGVLLTLVINGQLIETKIPITHTPGVTKLLRYLADEIERVSAEARLMSKRGALSRAPAPGRRAPNENKARCDIIELKAGCEA